MNGEMKTSRLNDSEAWVRSFEENESRSLSLPALDVVLSAEEREAIAASIAKFQLGEASEGAVLRRLAAERAARAGDAAYARAIELLVREENRHSAYLGAFMRSQGLPRASKDWTDSAFRGLRRWFGLEASLRALVTAEIVAISYYACLSAATKSPRLKAICARMLEDERAHVRFQMQAIHKIGFERSPARTALADVAHAALMAGTLLVVAWEHRRVIRRSGLSLRAFFGECYGRFRESMDQGLWDAAVALGRESEIRFVDDAADDGETVRRAVVAEAV